MGVSRSTSRTTHSGEGFNVFGVVGCKFWCEIDRKRVSYDVVVGRGSGMDVEGLKRVEEALPGLLDLITKDDLSAKLSEITILGRWDLRVGHAQDGFLGRSAFGTK
jgi:hypothetical protein